MKSANVLLTLDGRAKLADVVCLLFSCVIASSKGLERRPTAVMFIVLRGFFINEFYTIAGVYIIRLKLHLDLTAETMTSFHPATLLGFLGPQKQI